jgi:excisionase family DNA binding protein
MDRTEKIYTPRTLAKELGIPVRHVLRAVRAKELKCAKFSSCVFRIEGGDVDRWLTRLKKS